MRTLIAFILLTTAPFAQAVWEFMDLSDPMTDEVQRDAFTDGQALGYTAALGPGPPLLNVRCFADALNLFVYWLVDVRTATSLQIRLDNEPLFEISDAVYGLEGTDGIENDRIIAVGNRKMQELEILPRLLAAKRLRVRLLMPGDKQLTAEFDLNGARSPVARACREHMEARHPKLLREIQQSPVYTDELEAIPSGEQARENAVRSGQLDQWIEVIRQRVQRNWIRPGSARAGLECEVRVMQIPGGEVVDVRVGKCNGDSAVVRSIENAVYKASPLPPPPDQALFQRNITFVFAPE